MVSLPSVKVPTMASPLSSETRRRLAEGDRRWHFKLGLRITAALFSLIAASLFAAAIPQWNANFFHVSGPQEGDWQDGMPLAALVLSLLFNVTAVAYTFTRYRSFHPIMNMIFAFIVWALLVPSITFAAWGGLFEVWRPALRAANGKVFCNVLNSFAKECNPILYSVGGLELGGVVLSCIVWVAEIGLFTFAAIEVHRWRRARQGRLTKDGGRFVELGERGPIGQMEPDDLSLLKAQTNVKKPMKVFGKFIK